MSRDCYYGNLPRGLLQANTLGGFQTVQIRQRQVHQNNIGIFVQREFDRFIAIFGFDYTITRVLKFQSHEITSVLAIFDEQDGQVIGLFIDHGWKRWLSSGGCAAESKAGMSSCQLKKA